MPEIYNTVSGDMWDTIALKTLKNELYADKLVEANRHLKEIFVFPAGVPVLIPEITVKKTSSLPPWKRRS